MSKRIGKLTFRKKELLSTSMGIKIIRRTTCFKKIKIYLRKVL